nr:MAG TPA: hypothetical protein [Caudoviricetes sp.]
MLPQLSLLYIVTKEQYCFLLLLLLYSIITVMSTVIL